LNGHCCREQMASPTPAGRARCPASSNACPDPFPCLEQAKRRVKQRNFSDSCDADLCANCLTDARLAPIFCRMISNEQTFCFSTDRCHSLTACHDLKVVLLKQACRICPHCFRFEKHGLTSRPYVNALLVFV
jgi:hypothetical protein